MKLKNLFMNRNFFAMVIFTLIMQIIVASSTFLLAKLSSSVVAGTDSIFVFGLFVASLTLVYIPGALTGVFLEKWKHASFQTLLNAFLAAHVGNIQLYRDEKERETRHSLFVRESWNTIETSHHYLQDLIQTSLNVLFNIIAIGAAIDGRFLPAYLASAVIAVGALKLSSKAIGASSSKCQQARVTMTDLLINAWDTIVIGNRYNYELLERNLETRREAAECEGVKSRILLSAISNTATWCAMAPVLTVLCLIVIQSQNQPAILIALFATLHRQILTLQHIEVLVNSGLHFGFIKAQVQGVLAALEPVNPQSLRDRINFDFVRIHQSSSPTTAHELLAEDPDHLRNRSGRLTVRGQNGAGKSSLLQHLKSTLGSHATYLPAHGSLYFSRRTNGLSTGETLRASLNELKEQNDRTPLLLDEWDANLDQDNLASLDALIEQMAQDRLIIEVRHRA